MTIVQALAFLFIPWGVMTLAPHIKIFRILGTVSICYIIGIVLGNIPGLLIDTSISKILTEATVPIAIPLLLFSTDLKGWFGLAKKTILSFVLMCLSVAVVATIAFSIFQGKIDELWKLSGMMVGVYTGGTPNMTAIGVALDVRESTFALLNAVDILIGGSYLIFLITLGPRIFGAVLTAFKDPEPVNSDECLPEDECLYQPWKFPRETFYNLFLAIFGLGASAGLSFLLFSQMSVPFLLLCLTSYAVGLSFNNKVRNLIGSYEIGSYFLLIFCVAMGSLTNLEELFNNGGMIIFYVATIITFTVLLHTLLCALFKIDRDTAMITSVAGIFGPIFIGVMVNKLNNKKVLLSGMTTGLVGYAVGNYLGLSLSYLIKYLSN